MNFTDDLPERFSTPGPFRTTYATEQDYFAAWLAHAGALDQWLPMAVTGGALADRLAWVFAAAYQAACRHAFPAAARDGWLAFVASEANDDPTRPPVVLEESGAAYRMSGWKTWTAGASCVTRLIVKAGRGPQTRYVQVDREAPGFTLHWAKPARFLPELVQGQACFDATPLGQDAVLDGAGARQFSLLEPAYLYGAFAGFVLGLAPEQRLVSDALALLAVVTRCLEAPALDLGALRDAHERVQRLEPLVAPLQPAEPWARDRRLLSLYERTVLAA